MPAKQLKYHTQKIDGQHSTDEATQKLVDKWIADQKDGCLEHSIRRAVKPKSQKQLGVHFGLLIANTIAQANDMGMDTSTFLKEMIREDLPTGIGLTTDFLKSIFYSLCPIYNKKGERVTLSKASTLEASKHFEDCRNLLAGHGIYIPEPDPKWKQKDG